MGAWGLSSAGKDAQGTLGEIPRWQWDQAKKAWGNSNDSTSDGKAKSSWATQYFKNKAENGFATPDQIRATGQQLMPGVDPAIAARWQRLAQKDQNWQTMVPKAGDIMPQISTNLDQQGGNIGQNYTDNENIIKQGTGNLKYLADAAYQDNVGSIKDSYDNAQANLGQAYDAMGNRIEGNFGGLIKESGDVYSKMGANVDAWGRTIEDLKPGSEASVATTARQFAPAMSAAGGRLRRAGIDPNSIQAASVLGDVEARRAVAMDDKAAEGQAQYVDAQGRLTSAKNDVLGAGFASKAGLTTGMTDRLTGLGSERAGIQTSLDLGRGRDFRGVVTDNRDTQMGIEGQDRSLNLANTNASFQQGQNLLDKRNDTTLLGRDLAMADYGITNGLLDQQNAEELVGLGLKNDQMNAGMGWQLQDQNTRDSGAQAVSQQGEADQNRGLAWQQSGNQSSGQAMDGYQGTLTREQANSGWLKKALLGAGSMAANYFLPGSGAFISGAAGGGQQQANPYASILERWKRGNPYSAQAGTY